MDKYAALHKIRLVLLAHLHTPRATASLLGSLGYVVRNFVSAEDFKCLDLALKRETAATSNNQRAQNFGVLRAATRYRMGTYT